MEGAFRTRSYDIETLEVAVMTVPTVSVLMPVFNCAPFIKSALRSVCNQSLEGELEVIVVDDHSTDGTRELSGSYDDPRVRVFSNSGRKGVGGARNTCLQMSSAPFLVWMDGDDISLPTRVTDHLRFLRRHPEVDVVGSDLVPIDAAGRFCGRPWTPPLLPAAIRWAFLFGVGVINGTTMVRRGVYERFGQYDETLPVGEDNEFWLRTSPSIMMANLPSPLLLYRRHRANTTTVAHHRSVELGAELTRSALSMLIADEVSARAARILRNPRSITREDVLDGSVRKAIDLLGRAAARFDEPPTMTKAEKNEIEGLRAVHHLQLRMALGRGGSWTAAGHGGSGGAVVRAASHIAARRVRARRTMLAAARHQTRPL